MFRKLIDSAANYLAASSWGKKFIEGKLPSGFERWAKVLSVKIDSSNQEIEVLVDLKGEQAPLPVSIRYHLEARGEDIVLVPDSLQTSKDWIQIVANDFLAQKKEGFVVPAASLVFLGKLRK